jgi:diacylglycerol kinase (ATP)
MWASSTLFIINPESDFGRTRAAWEGAKSMLNASGMQFDQHMTGGPGEATAVTRQALLEGVCQVVAVGGDGTLNEVVNGYLDPDGNRISSNARLALLPSGTGSDFKKTLALSNLKTAVEALQSENTGSIDAGRVQFKDANGTARARFFINMVSIGLGGDVSSFVNGWRSRLPKWIGGGTRFTLAAIRALTRYRTAGVDISFDLGHESCRLVHANSNLMVIGNGRFAGGGMLLAPDARPDDGLLEVVITDGASRLDVIRELPRIRQGGYIKNPKVSAVKARSVSIVTDRPLPLDIDGESEGTTPAEFSVLPGAIRFAL